MQASTTLKVADGSAPLFHLAQATDTPASTPEKHEATNKDGADEKPARQTDTRSNDPLRWFGILTPPSLRQAQTEAKSAVEVIPQLVGLDVEMRELEIEIRRARKKVAKAESAAAKAQTKIRAEAETEQTACGEADTRSNEGIVV